MCEENLDVSHLHMPQENKTVWFTLVNSDPVVKTNSLSLRQAWTTEQNPTATPPRPTPSNIHRDISGILRVNAIRLFQ